MATVDVRTPAGDRVGSATLDPMTFGLVPNVAVMHQVVTAQLAAARAGSHSTLTRAEVRGGGRKPWRQKGSGRARHGSIRSPQWTGGGVAMGPKPRSYRQRTPKKMIQLALRSALSDRAAQERVVVVERWEFSAPRTRDARAALSALGLDGRVLVVVARDDEVAAKSFRNLPEVHVLLATELNAYDVLCSDWVVFTEATLPGATVPGATADDEQAEAGTDDIEAGEADDDAGSPAAEGGTDDVEADLTSSDSGEESS
jgi:large subunit ribosomal protein L4